MPFFTQKSTRGRDFGGRFVLCSAEGAQSVTERRRKERGFLNLGPHLPVSESWEASAAGFP